VKISLIFIIFLLFFKGSDAQENRKISLSKLELEIKAHYGFLVPHHVEMQIFNAHFPVFEFTVYKATYGNTRWEYMYNYPLIGISLWQSNLGNSRYFGHALAVYPYINFPLNSSKNNRINFRLGFGLGYIQKPFNRINNYKNIAIGSQLNASLSFYFEFRKHLTNKITLTTGIGFMHFSNGATKTPNYGINIPSVTLGAAVKLGKENPYLKKKLLPELYPFEFDGKKNLLISTDVGFGIKSLNSEYGRIYYVYSLASNIFRQVSYKSMFGFGFDLIYDGSDYFNLEKNDTKNLSKIKVIRPGWHLAYQILVSKTSLILNLGT